MKKADFENACRQTPVYMARFRITKITPWMESEGVRKGDFFLYSSAGSMIAERTRHCFSPHASHYEFVGYVRVVRKTDFGFEVIEEGK